MGPGPLCQAVAADSWWTERTTPDPVARAACTESWGFSMSAQVNGTKFRTRSPRRPLVLANRAGRTLPPEELWDLHGNTLFALACALLGASRRLFTP